MQIPDRRKRDREHHKVGNNINTRGGDKKSIGVDACFTGDLLFVDTLQEDNEDQRDAVKKIEPDNKPTRVVYLGLFRLRRHENSQEQEENRELGKEHGNPSNNFDVPEKLQFCFRIEIFPYS